MADQTTPERWVEQAFLCAERACGTVAADVVSVRIKTALACEALVAIFAAQEVANGEHMVLNPESKGRTSEPCRCCDGTGRCAATACPGD